MKKKKRFKYISIKLQYLRKANSYYKITKIKEKFKIYLVFIPGSPIDNIQCYF